MTATIDNQTILAFSQDSINQVPSIPGAVMLWGRHSESAFGTLGHGVASDMDRTLNIDFSQSINQWFLVAIGVWLGTY